MCGLVTFATTSWISLILRAIALVYISMATDWANTYCDKEYDGDDVDGCDDVMDEVTNLFMIATLIVAAWTACSLAGVVFGCWGTMKEPPEEDGCKCPCSKMEPVSETPPTTTAVVVGQEPSPTKIQPVVSPPV